MIRSVMMVAISTVLWLGVGAGVAMAQEERAPYTVAPVDPPGVRLRGAASNDGEEIAVLPAGTTVWVAGPEGKVDGVVWRWVRDEVGNAGFVPADALIATDPAGEPSVGQESDAEEIRPPSELVDIGQSEGEGIASVGPPAEVVDGAQAAADAPPVGKRRPSARSPVDRPARRCASPTPMARA